ncbi:fumarylacetoacetate hydrolase family protein [Psychroflexus planctonicus]|uniref:2-hydroxyhepta-2,4-diene-1,7-dioate isomerase n=1 Tax=Psychroflexus planctonicus TaxID=1526575 RepID=A0ABQ1SIX3_9FLAO|nr:fumarylacetoacetate hydrolase family protein [Psychroflexus planctonicus]GGE37171.1 2-hydroxyhepta-2,4-diene-1,7-dioate isomerase [Psychroflexus planctonicus]
MKVICVGRNYVKHIEELKNQKPDEPVIFLKPDSSILPKNQPFFIPPFSNDVHFETELVFRIDKVGKHISKKFASKYYSTFTLGIDFTARDLQQKLKEKSLPWELSKGFDGSCFVSNQWLNVSDFNLNDIHFSLLQNENRVQKGNSSEMIYSIDEIIAYVSQFFTLKIGDLIFTGTPAGVGPVHIDDELKGFVENENLFNLKIK